MISIGPQRNGLLYKNAENNEPTSLNFYDLNIVSASIIENSKNCCSYISRFYTEFDSKVD